LGPSALSFRLSQLGHKIRTYGSWGPSLHFLSTRQPIQVFLIQESPTKIWQVRWKRADLSDLIAYFATQT
jgi:hypothetical protein